MIKIQLPKLPPPRSIVFGSRKTGFFESRAFNPKNQTFEFLPPSYHEPIEFYERRNTLRCIKRMKFSNPTPRNHRIDSVQLSGIFRTPFFLTNGYTPFEPADAKTPKGHSVVFLINRLGEVIWTYLPDRSLPSSDHRTRSILAKVTAEGQLGLMRSYDRSYFEILDWKGKTQKTFDPSPYIFHHDFLLHPGNEMITLSEAKREMRKPWFFWRRPLLFLSSPIFSFNITSGVNSVLWDYLNTKNPFREKDWKWNAIDSTPFQNNFTHINSLSENGEGYLLSLRSLNKLVFVAKQTGDTAWTIGPSKQNTYATEGTLLNFYRQHHATFLNDGAILLFDNGKQTSRILKFKPLSNNQIEWVHEYQPSPPVFSNRHGSAFLSDQNDLVGFFPSTTPGSIQPNRIIEFKNGSEKETARLEYQFGYNAAGYRAEPISALPGTTSYNRSVPPCKLPVIYYSDRETDA